MPLIHAKLIEEAFTPIKKNERKKIATQFTDATAPIEEENIPPATLADVEAVLGEAWDFGLSAMTIDAIRALIAGE